MAEIAPDEQFVEDETDNDEVQDDEIQISDTVTTQAQQEEGKEEVTPNVQDKDGKESQVEINLQSSEQTSPLASLAVVYTYDLE